MRTTKQESFNIREKAIFLGIGLNSASGKPRTIKTLKNMIWRTTRQFNNFNEIYDKLLQQHNGDYDLMEDDILTRAGYVKVGQEWTTLNDIPGIDSGSQISIKRYNKWAKLNGRKPLKIPQKPRKIKKTIVVKSVKPKRVVVKKLDSGRRVVKSVTPKRVIVKRKSQT